MPRHVPARPLPMPIEIVMRAPALASADGPAFRIAVTLAAVFWSGECRPLPADEAGLCALARCGASGWRKARPVVMEALGAILPALDVAYTNARQRAEAYRAARAEAGSRGALIRWQKLPGAVTPDPSFSDRAPNMARTRPVTRNRPTAPPRAVVAAGGPGSAAGARFTD